MIRGVVDGSPAARAALQAGDVIVRFDGRPVNGLTEFRLAVASSVAGKPMALAVIRGREQRELAVTLKEAR